MVDFRDFGLVDRLELSLETFRLSDFSEFRNWSISEILRDFRKEFELTESTRLWSDDRVVVVGGGNGFC